MIYLDSSAVVKLVRREPQSTDLTEWLNSQAGTPLVSSTLVEVEVPRALRRVAPQALPAVAGVLARLYRIEVDAAIRTVAATFDDLALRTLDAIHLATAAAVDDQLDAFVSYDRQQLQLASAHGFTTASPGSSAR